MRSSTVEAIPTLLYGVEVSYFSLIVCALFVYNMFVDLWKLFDYVRERHERPKEEIDLLFKKYEL
jgi:hypothetical protein